MWHSVFNTRPSVQCNVTYTTIKSLYLNTGLVQCYDSLTVCVPFSCVPTFATGPNPAMAGAQRHFSQLQRTGNQIWNRIVIFYQPGIQGSRLTQCISHQVAPNADFTFIEFLQPSVHIALLGCPQSSAMSYSHAVQLTIDMLLQFPECSQFVFFLLASLWQQTAFLFRYCLFVVPCFVCVRKTARQPKM